MATIGRYEIIEELGRGGFATVYKARDTQLNRLVALKVLHAGWTSDPDFVRRFQQEAETAANFRHPNIVVIYDVGEIDRQLFISMEYLPGQNLHHWLEGREGPLTVEEALPVLEPVADALDYAHKHGVVHRDIKPSNVMIHEANDRLRMVLTDFGLVKAMANSMAVTKTGQTLGSPEYMAPEQVDPNRQDEVGPPTDLYAFGIMAYQMLTGRVPFPGNSISTLFAHVNLDVPLPQEINDVLTDEVAACLVRMLAKAPGERFDTCAAFVAALDSPLQSGPDEHLKALYEQLVQAKTDQNWFQVLMLGGQIQGVDPGYRDVVGHIADAQEALLQPRHRESTDVWVHPKTGKVMVRVPAGPFLFGEKKEKQEILEFWIDKTPVTNAEYARFVAETGHRSPDHWKTGGLFNFGGQKQKEPLAELADHPVVRVTWLDAKAYAEWAGISLPSEEQWEKAARGTDGSQYPWGDEWEKDRCNYVEAGIIDTTPVGRFSPAGDSPYGCVDMSGNVWEWVADWYDSSTKEYKVVRGGSWDSNAANVRSAYRSLGNPTYSDNYIGFRCAAPGP